MKSFTNTSPALIIGLGGRGSPLNDAAQSGPNLKDLIRSMAMGMCSLGMGFEVLTLMMSDHTITEVVRTRDG